MAEQEQRVNLLLRNIEDEFDAFERLDDTSRAESKLRTITGMLRDCKACAPRACVVGTEPNGSVPTHHCPHASYNHW
jgi:hypothetical protein